MQRWRPVWLLVATCLLGCVALTSNAWADRDSENHSSERVRYVDKKAVRRVTVLKHRAERTETGLLKVKILLRNEDKTDAWITVKCVFLDEDGFEVEATNDEAVELPSKRETPYIVTSLGTQVYDYAIYIDNWSRSRADRRR